jgi:hypothetical protein
MEKFIVPDVTGEVIMDIVKILSGSPQALTSYSIHDAFPKNISQTYANRAITAACQLGLATQLNSRVEIVQKYRENTKQLGRSDLHIPFAQALTDYPPFMLYADLLTKGYSSIEAARMARGTLRIETAPEQLEQSLRRWGIYSKTVIVDKKTGAVSISFKTDRLAPELVERLEEAVRDEMKASFFVVDSMGPSTYAFFANSGISVKGMADSLLNYDNDPKGYSGKASETFELFLYRLGENSGAKMQGLKGPTQYAQALRNIGKIPSNNLLNFCQGIGALRNICRHAPDTDTGTEWTISKNGALATVLLMPVVIKAIHLNVTEGKQEF